MSGCQIASGNGHMCRARWLLHYRYLSCLLCCALHLLLQDKMVLFSPAREAEHLKATPQDQKQTSNTPAGPCQCSSRHLCCLSLQSVEITLTVPQTPPRTVYRTLSTQPGIAIRRATLLETGLALCILVACVQQPEGHQLDSAFSHVQSPACHMSARNTCPILQVNKACKLAVPAAISSPFLQRGSPGSHAALCRSLRRATWPCPRTCCTPSTRWTRTRWSRAAGMAA